MNQSQILIAEMSDADGVQICVKTRVERGLGQTKHIFIRSFDQFALFPNVIRLLGAGSAVKFVENALVAIHTLAAAGEYRDFDIAALVEHIPDRVEREKKA